MSKLEDVAKKAGVSLATASLALNNSELIKEDTKKRVKYWAKELNYYPNINARRLAKRKSYSINVVLNSDYFFSYSNIYYLRVLGGMIKEAESTEYSIYFSFYKEGENVESSVDIINSKNVDGIIIMDIINEKTLELIKNNTKASILLIDNHKSFKDMYGVDNDDFGGAHKAADYLYKLGHRKIGYIGLPEKHPLGKECWKGFNKLMNDKNIEPFSIYKECKFGIESGRKAVRNLLSKNQIASAFFCINDHIAIGVIEELKNRGFKIPEDISVIGMDDIELSSEIEPPLTTVKIEMEEIGRIGIKKLISIINNNYKDELKTIIPNKIIERTSCSSFKMRLNRVLKLK